MDHTNEIQFEVEYHDEAWYQFPQSFPVPKGHRYRTDSDRDWQRAECDKTVDLFCSGDWLQIIDPEKNRGIRYEIR